MSMERWDPFRDAMSLRDAFNRLFDESLMRPGSDWLAGFRDRPAMDVYETDDKVTVEAHLPGIKREEVEVTLSGTTLTIKGERHAKEELKEEHYLRREVHYGTFTRQITLPQNADLERATASFSDGVLRIVFPKQAAPQPKRIELEPESEPVTA
jgi:HSP20 family protein